MKDAMFLASKTCRVLEAEYDIRTKMHGIRPYAYLDAQNSLCIVTSVDSTVPIYNTGYQLVETVRRLREEIKRHEEALAGVLRRLADQLEMEEPR